MTPTTTQTPAAGPAAAERLAAEIKRRWRDGEPPDAAAALAEHPELLALKSVVIDLAYEEYCLLARGDGEPEVGPFCARMPAYRGSIRKVLEAHRMLTEHPEVLAPELAWPEPGEKVDGLEVVAELGRGTFARAYLAYDPQTDRACVLKLSPGRGGEGRALGPLQHPHITDVYWADRIGGMAAVCMPLLGVTTLDDVREAAFPDADTLPRSAGALLGAIQPTPGAAVVPPPVASAGESYAVGAAAVAARVADALDYLHRHNREHGDLKPSNVVLAPGGHPYLIDFNLAGDGDDAEVGGTVPYMAPERLASLIGAPAVTTDRAKADVYSFGVVFYELLTGRLPWAPNPRFGPLGAAAELLTHRRAGLTWPEAAAVPEPVAALVAACLADAPADRPAAADVAAALSRWLSAEREPVEPAPAKRRARPVAWAAGLAVAVAGLAAILWFGIGATNGSAGAAEPPEPPAALEPPKDAFRLGLDELRQAKAAQALVRFQDAAREQDPARALAYQAYCLARMASETRVTKERLSHLRASYDRGKDAVGTGANWAAVNNNIGYACIEHGWPEEALKFLDPAVEQSPNLTAARYNRAYARYKAMFNDMQRRKGSLPRLPDLAAAEDILRALAAPPESAEFYGYAARILAASAHLNPDLRKQAVRCMADAVRLGLAPGAVANDPVVVVADLKKEPGFDEVLRLSPPPGGPQGGEFRLVEPIQP
jgi:hypothetical protein